MTQEGIADEETYAFAIPENGEEIIYEAKETMQQISIHAENAGEAIQILKEKGIFQEGGFFISDIDNTLRTMAEGTFNGTPGRITDANLELITDLKENGWFFGTISNRSKTVVGAEEAIAQRLGYKSFGALHELSEFNMYGGTNPLDYSLKDKPETIDKVIEQLDKADMLVDGALKNKYIVWMGDRYTDENFGKDLLLALREHGYKNTVLIKLTDRLGDGFAKNDDGPKPINVKRG